MAGHIDHGSSHGKKKGGSSHRPLRQRIKGSRPLRATAAQRRASKRDQRLEPRR